MISSFIYVPIFILLLSFFSSTHSAFISIQLEVIGNADSDFAFYGQSLSPSSWFLDAPLVEDSDGNSSIQTFTVAPGSYQVTYMAQNDYKLSQIVCFSSSETTSFTTSLTTRTVEFTTTGTEFFACKFIIVQSASVYLTYDTDGSNVAVFASLTDIGGEAHLETVLDEGLTSAKALGLDPGEYLLTFLVPLGKYLEITCTSSGVGNDEQTFTETQVSLNLNLGDHYICSVFLKTATLPPVPLDTGKIVVQLRVLNKDTTLDFLFVVLEGTLPELSFNLDDPVTPLGFEVGNTKSFEDVIPGQYIIAIQGESETSYTTSLLRCGSTDVNDDSGVTVGNSRSATINVSKGETVFCVFAATFER